MDAAKLADFNLPPAGGTAVPVCLATARMFCELLHSSPTSDRLGRSLGQLVSRYADAAEVVGGYAPELFTVRELLGLVARVVTGEPVFPPGDLPGLPDRVRAASAEALRRLVEGRGGYDLRCYETALDRDIVRAGVLGAPPRHAPPAADDWLHVLHMSCQRADDAKDGTPEVSAVVVQHYATGQRQTFAAFQAAERAGPAPDPPEREAWLLRRFYRFVGENPGAVWLHWNMNEAGFGFAVLAQRYRLRVGDEPPAIPAARQFDLSEHLKQQFGPDYVGHPRLHKMIELNGLQGTRYLDPDSAGRAWAAGHHAAVLNGLSAKVSAVAEMYRLLLRGGYGSEGAGSWGPAPLMSTGGRSLLSTRRAGRMFPVTGAPPRPRLGWKVGPTCGPSCGRARPPARPRISPPRRSKGGAECGRRRLSRPTRVRTVWSCSPTRSARARSRA